jgi:hypothetical protein
MNSTIYADTVEIMVEICAELSRAGVRFTSEYVAGRGWAVRLTG